MAIGVAALVVMTAAGPVPTESPEVGLSADTTALLLCGTACPTWNDAHVEDIKNQFIAPTHPGQVDYVAVTAPMELWPFTGIFRVLGLLGFGEPGCARLGGDCWPDYPLWKLSGLFDLTVDQSVEAGVAALEAAMAKGGNDHLVIYGDNQGAIVANVEKRLLAERYPDGTAAPDIDFVLTSDFNVPNGGLHARFPGFFIPILDWTFDGPEPTNTPFHTDVIIRQYDGFADFPLYPLNAVATLNALLGVIYVSPFLFDVSLAPDPTATPPTVSQHGNTTYYFFETEDLPLFGPLRTLGVPESLIDVVEPFFRVLAELGYDRSIPPGEPTPARLIPPLEPAEVITDLVNAVGEGVSNALTLLGLPRLSSIPAPAPETAKTEEFQQVASSSTLTQTQQADSTGAPFDTPQLPTDTASPTAVIETARADALPQVASGEVATEADQPTSAPTTTATEESRPPKNATEMATATSTAASAVEPSAEPTPEASATNTSTPKPAGPVGQPVKPQSVVRDLLGVNHQLQGRSHRSEGDQPTIRSAAAGAGEATGARSHAASSSAASSSTANSSGGGASGGEGGTS